MYQLFVEKYLFHHGPRCLASKGNLHGVTQRQPGLVVGLRRQPRHVRLKIIAGVLKVSKLKASAVVELFEKNRKVVEISLPEQVAHSGAVMETFIFGHALGAQ